MWGNAAWGSAYKTTPPRSRKSGFLNMPELVTLGQSTYYEDECYADPFGPTPDVVLIQTGYGRTTNFWYHWIPKLADKYRVIRRDLRGHGRSSAPNRDTYDWSLDTMLAEIIDMLDQLKIDKVHFVGESTSGELGIALAVKYPQRLHSLITVSSPTHLPAKSCEFLALGRESWPKAVAQLGSEGWARELGKRPGTGARKSNSGYMEWWATEIGKCPTYGLEQYAVFLMHLDVRGLLKDVHVPTLILAPERSTATPKEYPPLERLSNCRDSMLVNREIKGSKLVWVDGEGHEIFVDRADKCVKEIKDFITSLHQE
jgi:pimeloyl-ACP methyl ester carboxylesterase